MNTRLVSRPIHPARRRAPSSFFSDFDRLFGATWPASPARNESTPVVPRIDVRETEAAWIIDAELPGLEQSDIDVAVDEGVLTLSGERKTQETQDDGEGFRHVERHRGSFKRSFRLPEDVDPEGIKAAYRNGVVSLTVPKPPTVEPEVLHIPVSVD